VLRLFASGLQSAAKGRGMVLPGAPTSLVWRPSALCTHAALGDHACSLLAAAAMHYMACMVWSGSLVVHMGSSWVG
jgi:hypothetical protein